eukprot:2633992-Pyramimonas_sp.AAC.1
MISELPSLREAAAKVKPFLAVTIRAEGSECQDLLFELTKDTAPCLEGSENQWPIFWAKVIEDLDAFNTAATRGKKQVQPKEVNELLKRLKVTLENVQKGQGQGGVGEQQIALKEEGGQQNTVYMTPEKIPTEKLDGLVFPWVKLSDASSYVGTMKASEALEKKQAWTK